jgi:hypothetical protein
MRRGLCDFLLNLYPKDHQDLFGAEMATVLRQAAEERRAMGPLPYICFTIWEMVGLLAGAAAVWAGKLAGQAHSEPVQQVSVSAADQIQETERFIQLQIDRMVYAIANHQFAQARFYSDEERKARARLEQLRGGQGSSE